jgi:hypothetical protein
MTFEDIDSAKEFNKAYVSHAGFPVRVDQHKAKNGLVTNKRFYCLREGFRKDKDEIQSELNAVGKGNVKGKSLDVDVWQWLLSSGQRKVSTS